MLRFQEDLVYIVSAQTAEKRLLFRGESGTVGLGGWGPQAGYCLVTGGGGGRLGPRPTDPPTHIRKFFLRNEIH